MFVCLCQAVEVLLAAQKELPAGDSGRGADGFGEMVEGEKAGYFATADDDRGAVEVGDVDAAGGGNGRGIDVADAVQSQRAGTVLAGAGIDAREDALVVRQKVESAVVQ